MITSICQWSAAWSGRVVPRPPVSGRKNIMKTYGKILSAVAITATATTWAHNSEKKAASVGGGAHPYFA